MTEGRRALASALLWLIFMNGFIASLISISGVMTSELPPSLLAIVYLILQQFGHFQFLSFLIGLPLVLFALILPSKRLIGSLVVILFSAFVIIIFIDYAVFRLYRFHLNGMVWNMLTGGAIEEIFVFDISNILTLGVMITLIVLIQTALFFYIQYRQKKDNWLTGWKAFALVIIVMLSGQTLYAFANAYYRLDILTQTRFIPLPQPITINKFLRQQGWAPDIKENPKLAISNKGHFSYPLKPLQCDTPANKPNILVIISDSLRFDMLTTEIMPNWSKLSEQSQLFTHHISTGNATRFGVYGLFTGLFGNYWFDSLNNNSTSVLIEQLKEQSYQFGFFTNARLSSPEFDKAVFSAVKEHIPPRTEGKDVISREYEITKQAKSFIENNDDKPFFGFVFFDAPHAYVAPTEDQKFQPALESINYLSLNNDSNPEPFLNRYKNAIHFTDRLTGEILDTLKKQGLMDNTIIILTGDHGQEMNETHSNSWGHNSNFSRYQVQVPMVIHWPGRNPQIYSHLSSHVDLVPTLMQEVFSCSNEATDYSNGQSLFDSTERDFVLAKNWTDLAIVNKQYIQVFPKLGPSETHEFKSYRKANETSKNNANGAAVIKSMSQFYK